MSQLQSHDGFLSSISSSPWFRTAALSLGAVSVFSLALSIVRHRVQSRDRRPPTNDLNRNIQTDGSTPASPASPASPIRPDVVLCGFPKKHDEPSASAFCQKAETFLRYLGVPYEHRAVQLSSSPTNLLPFIVTHTGELINDSSNITNYAKRFAATNSSSPRLPHNFPPLASLSASQSADFFAWRSYLEARIYPALAWERWVPSDNFEQTREGFRKQGVPSLIVHPLCWWLRRNIRGRLFQIGIGRQTEAEVREIISQFVTALSTKYQEHGTGSYFFGSQDPSELDLLIYAFVASSLTQSNPFFNALFLKQPALVHFTLGITKKLFPEYQQLILLLEQHS